MIRPRFLVQVGAWCLALAPLSSADDFSLNVGSTEKEVRRVVSKFVLRRTTGRGDQKQTKETVLGQDVNDGTFQLKPGERKVLDMSISYALDKELKAMGGVLGGLGKIGAFTSGEKDEFLLITTADVKGTALSPSAQKALTVTDEP